MGQFQFPVPPVRPVHESSLPSRVRFDLAFLSRNAAYPLFASTVKKQRLKRGNRVVPRAVPWAVYATPCRFSETIRQGGLEPLKGAEQDSPGQRPGFNKAFK